MTNHLKNLNTQQIRKLAAIGREYINIIPFAINNVDQIKEELEKNYFSGIVRYSYAINTARGLLLSKHLIHYKTKISLYEAIATNKSKRIYINSYKLEYME